VILVTLKSLRSHAINGVMPDYLAPSLREPSRVPLTFLNRNNTLRSHLINKRKGLKEKLISSSGNEEFTPQSLILSQKVLFRARDHLTASVKEQTVRNNFIQRGPNGQDSGHHFGYASFRHPYYTARRRERKMLKDIVTMPISISADRYKVYRILYYHVLPQLFTRLTWSQDRERLFEAAFHLYHAMTTCRLLRGSRRKSLWINYHVQLTPKKSNEDYPQSPFESVQSYSGSSDSENERSGSMSPYPNLFEYDL